MTHIHLQDAYMLLKIANQMLHVITNAGFVYASFKASKTSIRNEGKKTEPV